MPKQPEDIYTIQLVLRRQFVNWEGKLLDGDPYLELETPLCFTSIELAKAALTDIEEWVKDYAKVAKEGK